MSSLCACGQILLLMLHFHLQTPLRAQGHDSTLQQAANTATENSLRISSTLAVSPLKDNKDGLWERDVN